MDSKTLTFCQVSLARDIPVIRQNYESLKKFYKDLDKNVLKIFAFQICLLIIT